MAGEQRCEVVVGEFGWAIEQLKQSRKVRRRHWIDHNAHLIEAHVRLCSVALRPLRRCLVVRWDKDGDEDWAVWQATQEDLLADDWELVGEA